MAGRWYYRLGQNQYGPCTLAQLVANVESGQVTAQHWVREGETAPWQPAGQTPELRLGFEAIATNLAPPAKAIPAPHKSSGQLSGVTSLAKVVAAAPVARKAVAAPPPVRAAQAPPVAQPLVAPTTVRTAERSPTKVPARARSKSPTGLILGVLGGGVALLALAVVAAASGMFTSEEPTAAKKKLEGAKKAGEQSEKLADAQAKAVAAITKWREAGRATGGLKNIISFDVKRVTWQDSGDPRLKVELSITNVSSAKLTYNSWNAAGKNGAWLVDHDNDFIAVASGRGANNALDAGETITEILEFDTGKKNFDELRLVLPYSAVARTGHWGYSIPGKMLRGETETANTALATKAMPKPAIAETAPEPPSDIPSINAADEGAAPPGISASKTPAEMPAEANSADDDDKPKEDIRDVIKKSVKKDQPPPPADEMPKK